MASRLATLAVLLLLAWWLFDFAVEQDQLAEPPVMGGRLFPGLEPRDVDFVSLTFRTGHTLDLERSDGGPWRITYPTEELAQAEYANRVVENLSLATVIPVEQQGAPVDPAEVGLEDSPFTLTFAVAGHQTTVEIGDMDVFGRHVYARIQGRDEIVLTTPNLRTMVEQFRAEDYVDKHLLRGLRGAVDGLRVETPDGLLLDTRQEGRLWTLRGPVAGRADASRVPTLIRELQFITYLEVSAIDPDDGMLAQLGLPNARQIEAGDWAGATMLQLTAPGEPPARAFLEQDWKTRDDLCYAIREDLHKLVMIDRNQLNLLINGPDFFRERRALPPVREWASAFRITVGDEARLDIRRTPQGAWTFHAPERLAGTEVDTRRIEGRSSLSDFLTRLDGLSAVGFVEPPEGEPLARLVVDWAWGGRDRRDTIELFALEGQAIPATSSHRPGEGLLLDPEVLELLAPFVPDALRSLAPLGLDESRWARLVIHHPEAPEPLVVSRPGPDRPFEGDDSWGRRLGLGLQLLQGFVGYVWRPEREGAEYPHVVVFEGFDGEELARVSFRRPLPGEDREALGVPVDVARVSGIDQAVLLVPDFWLAQLLALTEDQTRQ